MSRVKLPGPTGPVYIDPDYVSSITPAQHGRSWVGVHGGRQPVLVTLSPAETREMLPGFQAAALPMGEALAFVRSRDVSMVAPAREPGACFVTVDGNGRPLLVAATSEAVAALLELSARR